MFSKFSRNLTFLKNWTIYYYTADKTANNNKIKNKRK